MESVWQGVILGVVQGLTEWLPISSEGVSTLIQLHFFDTAVAEAVTTALWLHVGTLAAAAVYFRRDIAQLLRHVPAYLRAPRADTGDERGPLITFLLIATVLSGAVGGTLLLAGFAEVLFSTGVVSAVVGGLLIVTGIIQRQARRRLSADRTAVGWKDGVLLGVVQGLAVLPGLSRSGLTVSALLFRGYHPERAIRLSFLMSMPVVLVAGVGLNITREVSFDAPSMAGLGAAFILGLATIGVLVKVATRVQFWKFCLVLGAVSFVPLLLEAL